MCKKIISLIVCLRYCFSLFDIPGGQSGGVPWGTFHNPTPPGGGVFGTLIIRQIGEFVSSPTRLSLKSDHFAKPPKSGFLDPPRNAHFAQIRTFCAYSQNLRNFDKSSKIEIIAKQKN